MLCPSRTCGSLSQPLLHRRSQELSPAYGQCQQQQRQSQRRRQVPPIRAEAAEQEAAAPADTAEAGPQRCNLCGVDLASAPRGCDKEGHVIKGLGSWPGFGWFEALRVYGPCPEAQKKGIAYTRKGQSLDEIMFGKQK